VPVVDLSRIRGSEALESQLRALVALRYELHGRVPALVAASDSGLEPPWLQLLSELTKYLELKSSLREGVLPPADQLWRGFASERYGESECPEVLSEVEPGLAAAPVTLDLEAAASYLDAVHEEALQSLGRILGNLGVEGDSPQPAQLRVLFEQDLQCFQPRVCPCASSQRQPPRIDWFLWRNPASAFWSIMSLGVILEHEYLSHLVPRSPLPAPIQEGWLVGLLKSDLRNRHASQPWAVAMGERGLLARLERELLGATGGAWKPDQAIALEMLFGALWAGWSHESRTITRELLAGDLTAGVLGMVVEALQRLAGFDDARRTALLGGDWKDLEGLSTRVLRS
jgi:hypothetical protein